MNLLAKAIKDAGTVRLIVSGVPIYIPKAEAEKLQLALDVEGVWSEREENTLDLFVRQEHTVDYDGETRFEEKLEALGYSQRDINRILTGEFTEPLPDREKLLKEKLTMLGYHDHDVEEIMKGTKVLKFDVREPSISDQEPQKGNPERQYISNQVERPGSRFVIIDHGRYQRTVNRYEAAQIVNLAKQGKTTAIICRVLTTEECMNL